jgi:Ca-activated chloride channel family protein
VSFAWPIALLGLLIVPAALLLYWQMQRRRANYAVRFTNLDLLANVVDRSPAWRRHIPTALYMVALAALVLALARPEMTRSVPKEEATVVLVVDVSGSMNAVDVQPTRLAAAQHAAHLLLDKLPEKFQVSLIAFANGVQLVAPPTTDRDLVRNGIDRLRAAGGTAMGDAIMMAVDVARPLALGDGQPVPQTPSQPGATPAPPAAAAYDRESVIILLSDGANTVGQYQPLEAAAEAVARNIPIFTIALGTPSGTVDVPDNTGRLRRVAVPPDEETLKIISAQTGGRFFSAPTARQLDEIYNDLGSRIGYEQEKREVTAAFAGIAALFLVMGGALSAWWFNRFP